MYSAGNREGHVFYWGHGLSILVVFMSRCRVCFRNKI